MNPLPLHLIFFSCQLAALDMQHRQAVARLITRQCRGSKATDEDKKKNKKEEDGKEKSGSDVEDSDSDDDSDSDSDEEKELQEGTSNGSKGAQFITSTFRPELVEVADKCFGVSFQHRISEVHSLQKRQALKFIRDLQQVEEAALASTNDRGSSNSTSKNLPGPSPSRNAGRKRLSVRK